MENTPYLYDTLLRVLGQHANWVDLRHLVAYLLRAGNISTPLPSRLGGPHQPTINLRNGFSRPPSTLLTGSQAHVSCFASRLSHSLTLTPPDGVATVAR